MLSIGNNCYFILLPFHNESKKYFKFLKPKIIVISGPSGAGKSTLLDKIFNRKIIKDNFLRTISYTTRSPRLKEKDGRDYYFVTTERFKELQKNAFFLEWQKVLNDFYGTPRYFLNLAEKEQKDLILCIDVKGGKFLKDNWKNNEVITIFIRAPNLNELFIRLKNREERKGNIKKRLNLAKKELQFINIYDYLVVNSDLREALKYLEAILIAERIRRRHNE